MPNSESSFVIGNGDSQPPRNSTLVNTAIRIMLAYSARKNTAKRHTRVFNMKAGNDFGLALGDVERVAVGFGRRRI